MSGVVGPGLTSESSDGRRQRAVGNINNTLALFIRPESVWLQQLKVSCHHFSLRNFWIPPVEIPAAVSPFIDLVKLAGSCPMLKHVSYKQFSWIFVFSNIVCYVDRLTFQLDSTATANVFCVQYRPSGLLLTVLRKSLIPNLIYLYFARKCEKKV